MADRDGGGNSPPVRECGDAPHVTRITRPEQFEKDTRLSSWSSPEKFTAHLQSIDPKNNWYGRDDVWNDANEHFSGVKTIDEAFDMCRNGWKEGGETIERTRSYIHALNPTLPKPIKYAIAGSTPNVPRAVAGNILNMRAPEEGKSARRKIITILYNVCQSCMVDKEVITNKAAVTAALIDVIEEQGFSCEVIVVARTKSGNLDDFLSIMIKESHHPVDTNRLAFCLGHSAMFRVLCFADWQSDPQCRALGRGLGFASSTQPSKELNERFIYTLVSDKHRDDKFKDIDTAAKEGVQRLISELQEQGCPAFPKKDHGDDREDEASDSEEDEDDDEYYDHFD